MKTEDVVKKVDDMNPFQKARMYGAYEREGEMNRKIKPIEDYFKNRRDFVEEVFDIGGEYQIAKVLRRDKEKEEEVRYYPFIKYQSLNTYCYSIAEAMIIAVADDYDGNHSPASGYFMAMLGMEKTNE